MVLSLSHGVRLSWYTFEFDLEFGLLLPAQQLRLKILLILLPFVGFGSGLVSVGEGGNSKSFPLCADGVSTAVAGARSLCVHPNREFP